MPEESTTPDLVELARRPYEAFNEGDFDAMMSVYGPDTAYEIGFGVLHGPAEIRGFYEERSGAYETFDVALEEVRDLGNGVTFAVAFLRGQSS